LVEADELGYPWNCDPIVISFAESLQKVTPSLPDVVSPRGFYTAKCIDWNALGLRPPEGDPKLRLLIRSVNSLPPTMDYSIYVGDRDIILQMIAHAVYIEMELENFHQYFDKHLANSRQIKEKSNLEFDGIIAP